MMNLFQFIDGLKLILMNYAGQSIVLMYLGALLFSLTDYVVAVLKRWHDKKF